MSEYQLGHIPEEDSKVEVPPLLRSSPELDKLYEALSAAQGEMTDPAKNKTAKVVMKTGGTYTYKYSDLADILKIARPILSKHGLCLIQFPVNPHRDAVTIITRIGHKSGQFLEADLTLPVGDDKPQTLGSAITYGRRYSGGSALGMSPDEDEDGQVAQSAAPGMPKSAGRSRTAPPAAAGPGAITAAQASLKSDLGVPKSTRGFRAQNKGDMDWIVAKLQAENVLADHWDRIVTAMEGRPSSDLTSVLHTMALR